ncbi:hypothetical protein HY992_04220 [Candidatus Micrarchaeota archaeon]|nr:hypothetical protein [Candidatus Micrarchaeota archaeon]
MVADLLPNWQVLASVAALANVFYGFILQKYGDFTGNPQTMAKGNEEIKKGIQTVLLVLFLMLFITAIYAGFRQVPMPGYLTVVSIATGGISGISFNSNQTLNSTSGCELNAGNGNYYCDPIGHARAWIDIQAGTMLAVYSMGLMITSVFEPLSTLTVNVNLEPEGYALGTGGKLFSAGVGATPFSGLLSEPLKEVKNMMGEAAGIIQLLDLQHGLLDIAEYAMAVFLPIGIILRSFPPTRLVGAFLASLGIVLYLVFPLTFYLLDVLMKEPFEKLSKSIGKLTSTDSLITMIATSSFPPAQLLLVDVNYSVFPPTIDFSRMLHAPFELIKTQIDTISSLFQILNLFVFISKVFPFFSLILCVICLFSFTKVLS